jgi:hypothetical protein
MKNKENALKKIEQIEGMIKNVKTSSYRSNAQEMNDYFKNLPFNGQIKTQLIVDAIQGVTGVVNVSLTEINCRSSFESYGDGVTLFSLPNGVDNVFYNTYAGYVVNESAPHDFNATINYYVMQ